MNVIDKIFKIGMLTVALVFVIVYFMSSQSNRYHYIKDDYGDIIFDTKAGIKMKSSYGEVVSYDYPNKTVTRTRVKHYKED